jgi:aerobic-type carbon monoxide dehydrogenase small subunit (CoxS/CutS family)
MIQLTVNKRLYQVDVIPDTLLLWILRDNLGRLSLVNRHPLQQAWIEEDVPRCGSYYRVHKAIQRAASFI